MRETNLVSRNVNSASGRTSIRLEPELWDALDEICRRENLSLMESVQEAETKALGSGFLGGRTSALRVHIVTYFRLAATEVGHHAVGHGASV